MPISIGQQRLDTLITMDSVRMLQNLRECQWIVHHQAVHFLQLGFRSVFSPRPSQEQMGTLSKRGFRRVSKGLVTITFRPKITTVSVYFTIKTEFVVKKTDILYDHHFNFLFTRKMKKRHPTEQTDIYRPDATIEKSNLRASITA